MLDERTSEILDILGFCGCGRPQDAAAFLVSILPEAPYGRLDWKQVRQAVKDNPEGAAALIEYWLDDRGFTEHGSAVPGWATTEGVAARQAAQELVILEGNE